ncbi:unnamed protein product [Heterobilharzia americana]|nr:unnamed protein product [Heterobilharzia americana]
MSTPEVVFANVSEDPYDLKTLLDGLLKIDHSRFSFKIDCKYYTADILIRSVVKTDALSDPSEISDAHGMIIYFDGDEASSWNDALSLMRFTSDHDIPIRLLVCHRVAPSALLLSEPNAVSAITRIVLEHGFELVEVSPAEDAVEEGEEFGVRRIKSVLEAHIWPNMKPKETVCRGKLDHLKQNEKQCDGDNQLRLENDLSVNVGSLNLNSNAETSSTCDEDDFEDLFRQLPVMRDEIASLDSSDRYRMAEKITCKIWRAIGGSEEEISGLHSDSD